MKPGWRTSEFWLSLLSIVLINVELIPIPDEWKWAATIAVAVGYQISRGLAKTGEPTYIVAPTDPSLGVPQEEPEEGALGARPGGLTSADDPVPGSRQ